MPEERGRFEIVNKLGMHARAAAVFVQLANKYASEIKVRKGDVEANGKSIMGVLQLAAVQGDTVEVLADGADCQAAIKALGELIGSRFNEDE